MLEGTLPFNNKDTRSLFKLIKKAQYEFVKTTDPEAKDLINRMLQPNPLKRICIEDIKEHPWFKRDLAGYLFDFKQIYVDHSVKKVDQEIYEKLFTLNLGLNPADEKKIKKAILKKESLDFWGVYNELLYLKTQDAVQALCSSNKKKAFTKRTLKKEAIMEMNQMGKNINSYMDFLPKEKDEDEKPRVASYSSMNTNETITPDQGRKEDALIDSTKMDDTPKPYSTGVSFKMDFRAMMELVFTTLKDMKMIWKRLNSDFVYKCHNGIPVDEQEKFKDRSYYKEFSQKEMLKFFIQFSAVDPRTPNDSAALGKEASQKEYLWSFIWIKGNSVKFLEFVSKFQQTVLDKIDN